MHIEPAHKARQRLQAAVRRELNHWTTWRSCREAIGAVNAIAGGWSHYFHFRHCTRTFNTMQYWLRERCRRWLWLKYGRSHGRYAFFTDERLHGQYQLFRFPTRAPYSPIAKR